MTTAYNNLTGPGAASNARYRDKADKKRRRGEQPQDRLFLKNTPAGDLEYVFTGHVENVEVAVSLGFRRVGMSKAVTGCPHTARKMMVHSTDDSVPAAILLGCIQGQKMGQVRGGGK